MNAHPLDNPIWEALHTHHARFASGDRGAARYAAEVAPFAAVGDADPESSAVLARLLAPGEHLYGVGPAPAASAWLHMEEHGPLAQMVWTAPFPAPSAAKVIPLTAAHLPDMLELAALVYPAYFRPRTPEMGHYLGVYDGPRLAAMAGERMYAGSWREVSAVCTHPDYLGRGLARQLTLYDRLGFAERSEIPYWLVRRSTAPPSGRE